MRFLHWLTHELRAVLAATLFFGICFGLMILLKKLLLEQYDLGFTDYMSAVVITLITAKVVVLFDRVPFGRTPGLAEVVLRTSVYSLAAFLLLVLEHGLSKRVEAGGFVAAVRGALQHVEAPRIWASLVCVGLAFAAYCTLAILRRAFGDDRIAAAFLRPPPPPGAPQDRTPPHAPPA